jgi:uncharacterized protein (DUF952 family)
MTGLIFHITSRKSWAAAEKYSVYYADSSLNEGFIHCSKVDQIMRVANSFFINQHDLVILEIDLSKLKSKLLWEPGTDKADEVFPHIYGPLNLDAIVHVFEFEPGPQGMFSLPGELI